jgi:hypothetical protein
VKLGRNDLCICGSGRKVKRCCGVDALRERVTRATEAGEELLALAYHFPRFRPQSAAFDAWAVTAPEDPSDDALADGLATLDTDERRRIVDAIGREQAEAWESVLADFGNDELAVELLLAGAVAAGVNERRRPLDEALWLLEFDGEVDPVTALATAIQPEDLWSVVESAVTAVALDEVSDDLDDDEFERRSTAVLESQAARLRTAWHDERLNALLARLRERLPDPEYPRASAMLLDAVDRADAVRSRLATALLSDSLDRIYAAA